AGVRRDELQRRRLGSGGSDDNSMLERAMLFQLAHHVGNGGGFLAHRHVDALNAGALLVDDGIDRHGGLAGLAVADDQLALTATNRHHGVDGLETGLHRLIHRLTRDDTRRHLLDRRGRGRVDRPLAIDGIAQRIDHTAQQGLADRHFQHAPGALDGIAFLQVQVVAQHHGTDGVALEVERQAEGVARELEHFVGHRVLQAVDTDDAVRHGNYGTFRPRLGYAFELFDALPDDLADFGRIELH